MFLLIKNASLNNFEIIFLIIYFTFVYINLVTAYFKGETPFADFRESIGNKSFKLLI